MCHPTSQAASDNNIMWSKKGMLSYNPTHGIIIMEKHVMKEHNVVLVWYKKQRRVAKEGGDGE